MIRIIFEGVMLGVSAGVYCAGTCLVFFMPYLLVEGEQKISDNLKKISLFMLGRLIAYISFALIMGLVMSANRNIFTAKFSHISLIIASLVMLAYALAHNFSGSQVCGPFLRRFSLMRIPFLLGLFTGLNPCPPFLVGVARLSTINDILRGVVLFSAFFLGTSVYMIPLAFVSYLNRSERVRRIGVIIAMLSGIWFLFIGISGLLR